MEKYINPHTIPTLNDKESKKYGGISHPDNLPIIEIHGLSRIDDRTIRRKCTTIGMEPCRFGSR
jgi:hypothetical protein